jgi:hypothetical protein
VTKIVGLFPGAPCRQSWLMPPSFRREPGRPGKHEPPAPSRSVDVRIPTEILERLEAIAAARGISRHQVIREALARYVEMEAETHAPKPDPDPRQD